MLMWNVKKTESLEKSWLTISKIPFVWILRFCDFWNGAYRYDCKMKFVFHSQFPKENPIQKHKMFKNVEKMKENDTTNVNVDFTKRSVECVPTRTFIIQPSTIVEIIPFITRKISNNLRCIWVVKKHNKQKS